MPQLPAPLRAAVGLAATAAEEARRLPERALELPMLAVSTALQASLRAQQHYARLTARGDQILNRRHPSDEPPPWATFDEPVTASPAPVADEPVNPVTATPVAPRTVRTKPATAPRVRKGPATRTAKTITAPRNGKPSAFDSADE